MATCTDPIRYSYDALSRTVQRTQGSNSVAMAYRGISEDLVASSDATSTTLVAQGVYGPLAQDSGDGAAFFAKDLHSDVVGLYGANSGTQAFDPWGEALATSGDAPALGFQSDWTDPDTGQVDMGTRMYEPSMGRFATQDILFGEATNPNTLNQYVYGNDSPLVFTDPTGMAGCKTGYRCQGNPPPPPPGTTGGGNNNGNPDTDPQGAGGTTTATATPEPTVRDMMQVWLEHQLALMGRRGGYNPLYATAVANVSRMVPDMPEEDLYLAAVFTWECPKLCVSDVVLHAGARPRRERSTYVQGHHGANARP